MCAETSYRRPIERENAARLGDLLESARRSLGWTHEKAAEEATLRLEAIAEDGSRSAAERETAGKLAANGGVTRHHISNLEDRPRHPLTPIERRVRLLALARALNLDLATVNRLAGAL